MPPRGVAGLPRARKGSAKANVAATLGQKKLRFTIAADDAASPSSPGASTHQAAVLGPSADADAGRPTIVTGESAEQQVDDTKSSACERAVPVCRPTTDGVSATVLPAMVCEETTQGIVAAEAIAHEPIHLWDRMSDVSNDSHTTDDGFGPPTADAADDAAEFANDVLSGHGLPENTFTKDRLSNMHWSGVIGGLC